MKSFSDGLSQAHRQAKLNVIVAQHKHGAKFIPLKKNDEFKRAPRESALIGYHPSRLISRAKRHTCEYAKKGEGPVSELFIGHCCSSGRDWHGFTRGFEVATHHVSAIFTVMMTLSQWNCSPKLLSSL